MDDKHKIKLELNDLEWEIVNKCLEAPLRDYLIAEILDIGYKKTESEIQETWRNMRSKWSNTW